MNEQLKQFRKTVDSVRDILIPQDELTPIQSAHLRAGKGEQLARVTEALRGIDAQLIELRGCLHPFDPDKDLCKLETICLTASVSELVPYIDVDKCLVLIKKLRAHWNVSKYIVRRTTQLNPCIGVDIALQADKSETVTAPEQVQLGQVPKPVYPYLNTFVLHRNHQQYTEATDAGYALIQQFAEDWREWQQTYQEVGASDTESREAFGQEVARKLGIIRIRAEGEN